MTVWPISIPDVLAARRRIAAHLPPTPLRRHPLLDEAVGHGISVLVKHEGFQPTQSFKARNGLSLLTALAADERARGVVAATRGNHGQGLAWAGSLLGIPVTICVPVGNSPDKNAAMRAWGATLIESGADYDESLAVATDLVSSRGLVLAHSTNDPRIIAGAATMSLEMVEAAPDIEAFVLAVGGGSQAVGALTIVRTMLPGVPVYGVQAEGAPAIHDSWHAGAPVRDARAVTIADGLATRSTYALSFPALRAGLSGFVKVSDAAIADAVRVIHRATHSLVEPAGAAGLAGLFQLRDQLRGKRVAIALSGANIDAPLAADILSGRI